MDETAYLTLFEEKLTELFQTHPCPSERLKDAMEYSISGGKRLRPLLIYCIGQTLKADLETLHPPALAIELIHGYSLIHDDLPAMDNDDMRRNKPSCHKAFDEASAILAGDALQTLAFQVIAETPISLLCLQQKIDMLLALSRAIGANGLVAGQALDLECLSKQTMTLDCLPKIYTLKTGSLFRLSANFAFIASKGTDPKIESCLYHFTQMLGIAFQMQDDYIDRYGTSHTPPKNSDLKQNKQTYATYLSQAELASRIEHTYIQAHEALEPFGRDTPLSAFTEKLQVRTV